MTGISVIVPVRDDPAGIVRTVASLHAQSLPHDRYEVIVVDNGSADGTVAAARCAAEEGPARVRVVQELAVPTSYGARNRGIAAASGSLLCFVDADMAAPEDYLAIVATAMDELDYAGCAVEVEVGRPTAAALHNRLFGFPVERYLTGRGWVPTCCLTVRRSVVEALGGFRSALPSGGDVEFGRRVAAAGYRQGMVRGVALRHPARSSVRALTRKARRTAAGKAQLAALDPAEAAAVRAYRSWARLRPLCPLDVRRRLLAQGLPAGSRQVLGVVALKSWLDLVRLLSALRA